MLSIRFDSQCEWWVSGATFERLFQTSIGSGVLPIALEHWRHIADANGGFSLSSESPQEAEVLTHALLQTARGEVRRLARFEPASPDHCYVSELTKLLQIMDDPLEPSDSRSRCPAGQACPREGYWWTPARSGSRKHFSRGQVMPEVKSEYGTTVWQWDEQQ